MATATASEAVLSRGLEDQPQCLVVKGGMVVLMFCTHAALDHWTYLDCTDCRSKEKLRVNNT